MNHQETKEKLIEQIVHHFSDELISIFLFGSFETEHETKSSDIDIAILCKKPIDKLKLWDVTQELAIAANKDIDLVDLRSASTVLQMQVINSNNRIYTADKMTSEKFEDFVFSSYIRFNESRKEILDDIKSRGSVYG